MLERETDRDSRAWNKPATPDELPPPPDLTGLPPQILHSGTVETLIGQNDDLMARLKFNIRRNAMLEQQILEQERVNSDLVRSNAAVSAQLQILEEKDLLLREKTSRAEGAQSSLQAEIEFLRTQVKGFEERNSQLKLAARYVNRIRRWVTPMIDRLKIQLADSKKQLLKREATISDLRLRLSDSTAQIQANERQAAKDQGALVDRYEGQLHQITQELDRLRTESKLARDKAAHLDRVVAEFASQSNHVVFLERQIASLQGEIDRLNQSSKRSTAAPSSGVVGAALPAPTSNPATDSAAPSSSIANC
jgi:chromosome segregation ATPase